MILYDPCARPQTDFARHLERGIKEEESRRRSQRGGIKEEESSRRSQGGGVKAGVKEEASRKEASRRRGNQGGGIKKEKEEEEKEEEEEEGCRFSIVIYSVCARDPPFRLDETTPRVTKCCK